MRAVKMFFTGSIAAATVALLACGGSSESPAGATDSGASTDGTVPVSDSSLSDAPAAEASEDAGVVSDGACEFGDANLFTSTPADAALDDAGASVGTCVACAQTQCQSQVTGCNADACCESVFSCVFDWLGSVGGSLLVCYETCGAGLSTSADPAETKLAQCAAKSCATECALCSFDSKLCQTADSGAPDGSSDAAGDAADAAGD